MSLLLPLVLLAAPAHADLDVAFVIDTTGSMSGELREATTTVRALAEALRSSRPQEEVRIGVVAYRDRGDAYLTQLSPLDANSETAWTFLRGLDAAGGGDAPEDVVEGVRVALGQLQWTAEGDKQVFLIGDAPAQSYPDAKATLDSLIADANRQQVVINAVGCRSLSKDGADWFRRLAYGTEGTYSHIGRVAADQDGLAATMLQTLAAAPADNGAVAPLRAWPSTRSVAVPVDVPLASGVLVRLGAWLSALEKAAEAPGELCTLTVMLPDGAAMKADPVLRMGSSRLEVDLQLQAGSGSRTVYELERCLPADTPIEVAIR
jgi:von Willebrand factor type A domain